MQVNVKTLITGTKRSTDTGEATAHRQSLLKMALCNKAKDGWHCLPFLPAPWYLHPPPPPHPPTYSLAPLWPLLTGVLLLLLWFQQTVFTSALWGPFIDYYKSPFLISKSASALKVSHVKALWDAAVGKLGTARDCRGLSNKLTETEACARSHGYLMELWYNNVYLWFQM